MKVIQAELKGYRGYSVTNKGEVISYKKYSKGRLIKQSDRSGYKRVKFWDNGKPVYLSVHRLVAEAFLGKVKGKEYINHKNGIKSDNRIENLEWVTSSENMKDSYRTGRHLPLWGESNGCSKLKKEDILEIRKFIKSGVKQRDIAKIYKVNFTTINKIKMKINWKHI